MKKPHHSENLLARSDAKPKQANKPGTPGETVGSAKKRKVGEPPQDRAKFRDGSKSAKIIKLLSRTSGATMKELLKTTGWQAHSVRGFLSTAGKKHGITIDSAKNDSGDRVYRVTK